MQSRRRAAPTPRGALRVYALRAARRGSSCFLSSTTRGHRTRGDGRDPELGRRRARTAPPGRAALPPVGASAPEERASDRAGAPRSSGGGTVIGRWVRRAAKARRGVAIPARGAEVAAVVADVACRASQDLD